MTPEAIQAHCRAYAPRAIHPRLRVPYFAYFAVTTLLVLPFWVVKYAIPRNRPRPSWSLSRCLHVSWSRRKCSLVARCEIDHLGRDLTVDPNPAQLSHSHPVTIPPVPLTHIIGHPAKALAHIERSTWVPHFVRGEPKHRRWERKEVTPLMPIKAFWFTGEKTWKEENVDMPSPGERVYLHFHGGGYVCGTAAETDLTSTISKALVGQTRVKACLSVDYRLAPQAPWPMPLLDAIGAYKYLIDKGLEVILVGDSAGGHLALALARWLRDDGHRVGLPMPMAQVLFSPWCDVGFSSSWGANHAHNAKSDTIDDTFGPFATSLLLRGLPVETMNTPYLSPASLFIPEEKQEKLFTDFPPTFLVYGGAERLALSIGVLWERLCGEKDLLVEGPDSVHDFMIFPWQAKEAAVVYQQLEQWLGDL